MAMFNNFNQTKWRAVDILSFSFLLFLIFLTIVFHWQIPNWVNSVVFFLFLSGVIFFLVLLNQRRGKILGAFHELIFPAWLIYLIFTFLGDNMVPYLNSFDGDKFLIQIDYALFGAHPTVVLEGLSRPWLTDILQIVYASFYFLPIFLLISLAIKKEKKELNFSLFLLSLCFYLTFIGYILVPALGPRFTLDFLQNSPLEGSSIHNFIQKTLNSLEGIKKDAFPSGHTAVTLVVLYLSFCFRKRLFFIYLPISILLVFSTVYLRYHYVIDVIAGFLLAGGVVFFGKKIYEVWEKKIEDKSLKEI